MLVGECFLWYRLTLGSPGQRAIKLEVAAAAAAAAVCFVTVIFIDLHI